MASEDTVIAQGLECILCFELLKEPKLLSCTHTFCANCIARLYQSQINDKQLLCPVCRQITQIPNKDVSSLKTNFPIKSLVFDIKTARKICSVCDPEDKSPAVSYCQTCAEYMCDSCLDVHRKWKKNKAHDMANMDDIRSGKVRIKRTCKTHPTEETELVCTSCTVAICFKCRVFDHEGAHHVVETVTGFIRKVNDQIDSLQMKSQNKIESMRTHTASINYHRVNVGLIFEEKMKHIHEAYEEAVTKLTDSKNELLNSCEQRKQKLTSILDDMSDAAEKLTSNIKSSCELISNGKKALLEGQALHVHNSLCGELQATLDRNEPGDETQVKLISQQAEGIEFKPYQRRNEINLGEVRQKVWTLQKAREFTLSGYNMYGMAPTPDGRMIVVGYDGGGIEIFNINGSRKTALDGLKVLCLSVMSNGRYVIRDHFGKVSVYTSTLTKLRVRFMTDGGWGGMGLDRNDNIYVGHYDTKMIEVFSSEGGYPLEEIPCPHLVPWQICLMNNSKSLVVSDDLSVGIIDHNGTVHQGVLHPPSLSQHATRHDYKAYPVVLQDDTILVGWKKNNNLSVYLYTNELTYVRSLIHLRIHCGGHTVIRALPTGQVVVARRKLYILPKS